MVSDGVNVGSVWKTTCNERVAFPLCREKVSDLTSVGTAFQMLEQLYINPGNSVLFPIFSQIAACYEEYIPTHLKFFFRTEEYMASGINVSAGLCALATNFDANDPNFSSITAMENYATGISGPPFSGIIVHDVLEHHRKRFKGKSRDLALNNYYVYNSANSIGPTTDQAKFYDMGNLQCAVGGTQAAIIGELWVEYSFTMIHRKQPEFPIGGSAIHLKLLADDATQAAPLGLTPYTTGSPVSTGATVSGVAPGSTLDVVNMAGDLSFYSSSTIGLNDAAPTIINLPNVGGTWLVHVYWSGALTITAIPTMTSSDGATVVNVWGATGASASVGFFTAAGATASISKVVTTTYDSAPTSATNALTIAGLTSMTSGMVDVYITRLPTSLVTSVEPKLVESRLEQLERMVAQLLSNSSSISPMVVEECKESDVSLPDSPGLERSVHIPRSLFAKMLSKS